MTNEKIIEVCNIYRRRLFEIMKVAEVKPNVVHVYNMCLKTIKFVEEGRREKAFR